MHRYKVGKSTLTQCLLLSDDIVQRGGDVCKLRKFKVVAANSRHAPRCAAATRIGFTGVEEANGARKFARICLIFREVPLLWSSRADAQALISQTNVDY